MTEAREKIARLLYFEFDNFKYGSLPEVSWREMPPILKEAWLKKADQILALEGEDWKLKVLGKPAGVTNKDGEMLIPGDIPPDCFIFFMPFAEWVEKKEAEK